ncbi:MAG: aminotransferase class V-fold PLP-dependent enzyme [Xanthomonadales bacterium]|nr:aminotransferase class V-fold PLP-dependent enzyme [Xanthomonadales bacterium]
MIKNQSPDFDYLRSQIVGVDSTFDTPFGERMMVYCDYTASGRCLLFVENYLQSLQKNYANTHTEDDITGRNMTQLLHQAEEQIKRSVNAGPDGRIVSVGTGATGAIDKVQQILGIACPPATRHRMRSELENFLGEEELQSFRRYRRARDPVVFVGPYEHHSNEISWRQGYAEVVEVELDEEGGICLEHLDSLLQAERFQGRLRIGSFSAASNVSGMRTDVRAIARLLHRHDALACFDYAACAPYVTIDMSPADDPDAALDAVFISPHKFLGGPGSSGVLVFNRRIYPRQLPPTVAAGGTVDYVSPKDQDFIADIEEREKAGTPGVLQTVKAALAFQIKDWIGTDRISAREHRFLERAMERWQAHPNVEILGNEDPRRRIGIVSFNVTDPRGRYLHPKFLTALLNDLFGIQSRAGCSCAGPYGHRLLDIDLEHSEQYRQCVQQGYGGIKPGWCRVGFHYTMDQVETDYVIEAVEFIGQYGYRFLPFYDFDLCTGTWTHKTHDASFDQLSLDAAINAAPARQTALSAEVRRAIYRSYLEDARKQAESLADPCDHSCTLEGDLGELQFFALDERSTANPTS